MITGRWDECCPHCGTKIDELDCYVADYGDEPDFTMECPHCGDPINVHVDYMPEFYLTVPSGGAEQETVDCAAAQERRGSR